MEYELNDKPGHAPVDEEDSKIVRDHPAIRNQSSVKPEDYPKQDRAINIPEQEDG